MVGESAGQPRFCGCQAVVTHGQDPGEDCGSHPFRCRFHGALPLEWGDAKRRQKLSSGLRGAYNHSFSHPLISLPGCSWHGRAETRPRWTGSCPIVEAELKRIARRCMRGQRQGHTLQATALVNEAYLRLVEIQQINWQNRAHFLAMAARLMRRILVDSARARAYQKRGGGAIRVTSRKICRSFTRAQTSWLWRRLSGLWPRSTNARGVLSSFASLAGSLSKKLPPRSTFRARL